MKCVIEFMLAKERIEKDRKRTQEIRLGNGEGHGRGIQADEADCHV